MFLDVLCCNMTQTFRIKGLGGKKILSGELSPHGAKNAVLKVLAATALFSESIEISNIPDIEDVNSMILLLEKSGFFIKRLGARRLVCQPPRKTAARINTDIAKKLRASIVLTGPFLSRYGKISFPHPGGCVIGERPIDLFLSAFQKMGARVSRNKDYYTINAPKNGLRGANIFFENISVTATETLMLAAILARGETILSNCAMEPEIKYLAEFLNSCGARITGAGTPTICVIGGELLRNTKNIVYKTPPDRIETGSFLILGALCARDVTIKNCIPEHAASTIAILERMGVSLNIGKNYIKITNDFSGKGKKHFLATGVKTHEYPGFPTDLQALMTVFLTQASGEALVFETIFEGRLNYIELLNRMGARITSMDQHRILVKGPTPLRGRKLESPDLRAGLAYVIAALVAKGTSFIHNANYIDRGYEKIDERLREIGADIERV